MKDDLFSARALRRLLAVAVELGAEKVPGWSEAEQEITADLPSADPALVWQMTEQIRAGRDALGEQFCRILTPQERRPQGATYTPPSIVEAMLGWASHQPTPARVVDPGAGSGRFVVAAGRAFREASLVAVELDPVACLLCRGHVAAAGLADRCEVRSGDYRQLNLPRLPEGQRTLFIGNPPYVRHHLIGSAWKDWLAKESRRLGLRSSGLAGLHVYFYLATALKARAGDLACFITSAEWLDVNYGRMVRDLLLNGLGANRLVVLSPTAKPFDDADTTAVIACMEVGTRPTKVLVRSAEDSRKLGALDGGRPLSRDRLKHTDRWSRLVRRAEKTPANYIELGELFRVHRGQVTGANAIWIAEMHNHPLPARLLFPSVTRARELYRLRGELRSLAGLRRVVDLPPDLDDLEEYERRLVERFLEWAKSMGAHEGYVARHRRAWWSVGLREPAPILATYMARRPPAFVRNEAGARHVNIAHGLYPRAPMSESVLRAVVRFLSRNVRLSDGRTYAGGLTKFEPREMERIPVPTPEALRDRTE